MKWKAAIVTTSAIPILLGVVMPWTFVRWTVPMLTKLWLGVDSMSPMSTKKMRLDVGLPWPMALFWNLHTVNHLEIGYRHRVDQRKTILVFSIRNSNPT
jgi:hypothetical protein